MNQWEHDKADREKRLAELAIRTKGFSKEPGGEERLQKILGEEEH